MRRFLGATFILLGPVAISPALFIVIGALVAIVLLPALVLRLLA